MKNLPNNVFNQIVNKTELQTGDSLEDISFYYSDDNFELLFGNHETLDVIVDSFAMNVNNKWVDLITTDEQLLKLSEIIKEKRNEIIKNKEEEKETEERYRKENEEDFNERFSAYNNAYY